MKRKERFKGEIVKEYPSLGAKGNPDEGCVINRADIAIDFQPRKPVPFRRRKSGAVFLTVMSV